MTTYQYGTTVVRVKSSIALYSGSYSSAPSDVFQLGDTSCSLMGYIRLFQMFTGSTSIPDDEITCFPLKIAVGLSTNYKPLVCSQFDPSGNLCAGMIGAGPCSSGVYADYGFMRCSSIFFFF